MICAARSTVVASMVLLVATTLAAQNASGPDQNTVPNPGFEHGKNRSPAGWKFSSWKESKGEWDESQSFEGSHSAKLTGHNGGWSISVPVTAGAIHRLALRYRQGGGPAKIVTYVRKEDESRDPLLYLSTRAIPASQQSGFIDGQFVEAADENGWVLLDAGSFVPPAGLSSVSILIKLVSDSSDATAWLDDVRVTAEKSVALPETAAILKRVAGATIWTENENRKILRDQEPPSKKQSEGIHLDLAQSEYGVFQIAVSPERSWQQVSWKWDAFSGPAKLSADNLQLRRVEFVSVDKPLKPFGLGGLNPDPLTDRLPCDIDASTNQSFWFTLRIPPEQRAGTYESMLTLTRDDSENICRLPVVVRVRTFAIPSRPSIDIVSRMHATEVKAAEAGEDEEVLKRYYRAYFENRTRCATGVSLAARLQGDRAIVNADRFIEMLRFQRDEFGARPFFIPALWISQREHRMPADATWKGRRIFVDASLSELDPDFEKPFVHFMSQLVARLKAEDLFSEPIVRFIDEPRLDHTPTVNGIRTLALLMKRIEPKLSVSLTTTSPHADLFDVIDEWILHTDAWERGAQQIAAARDAGNRISVYNNGIAYLEQEPMRIRLWPWLLKKYDVDGSYSWCGTTAWKNAMEDPWNCGQSYFEVMFYPPRSITERGPIGSVRWELFRQGLQDYEYIHLAETLIREHKTDGNLSAAKIGRDAVESALDLIEKWPRVRPPNDRPYTRDPTKLAAARRKLADAIETMQATR